MGVNCKGGLEGDEQLLEKCPQFLTGPPLFFVKSVISSVTMVREHGQERQPQRSQPRSPRAASINQTKKPIRREGKNTRSVIFNSFHPMSRGAVRNVSALPAVGIVLMPWWALRAPSCFYQLSLTPPPEERRQERGWTGWPIASVQRPCQRWQDCARDSGQDRQDGLETHTSAPESSLCTLPGKQLSGKALPASKMD